MANSMLSACGEVIMWKRPLLAGLVLLSGTYVYHECTLRNRSIVSLIGDVLLVFFVALGSLGIYFRSRGDCLPVEWSQIEVSIETANNIVACFANTLGATEGVLRVAASGSDYKLFCKVVLVLYILGALGRAANGGTVAYLFLWIIFTLPFCHSKLAPYSSKTKVLGRQASVKPVKAAGRVR